MGDALRAKKDSVRDKYQTVQGSAMPCLVAAEQIR